MELVRTYGRRRTLRKTKTAGNKVRTYSSTEFGWNPILIDWIRLKSGAGPNPMLIVHIRTALDRAVDFNERITAFTTGRECMPKSPSSDINGGNADLKEKERKGRVFI